MIRLGLFLALALAAVSTAAQPAQPGEIRAYVGLESHRMGDLRDLQDAARASYQAQGIDAEIVDDFGPRFSAGLEATLLRTRNESFGLGAGFSSTGGRVHYGDYSGEIATDFVVSRTTVDLSVQRDPPGGLPVFADIRLRYGYTRFTERSRLRLVGVVDDVSESDPFTAHNVSVIPGLSYRLPLAQRFVGVVSVGYEFVLPLEFGNLRIDGQRTTARADWSGFRLGFALGLQL